MNQTNLLDLRSVTIGELFDRSFRLYRKHFGAFLGIMLLTQASIYLVNIVLSALTETTPNFDELMVYLALWEPQLSAPLLPPSLSLSLVLFLPRWVQLRSPRLFQTAISDEMLAFGKHNDEFNSDISDLTSKMEL